MNKLLASIVFGTGLLLSACTVHHYHHRATDSGKKASKCTHHGAEHQLPEGHPPVGHHGMKGHHMPAGHPPVKGHGMPHGHGKNGHHDMPAGHPPVNGHGSMKGHHGGMTGHDEAEHDKLHANLPAPVTAFHDSFAEVWHEESDAVRSTAGCAKAREWETLAKGVSQHKAQREQAIAYATAAKSLAEKVKGVSSACRQKKASVQAELAAVHDALHGVMKALAK